MGAVNRTRISRRLSCQCFGRGSIMVAACKFGYHEPKTHHAKVMASSIHSCSQCFSSPKWKFIMLGRVFSFFRLH
ncbi:hypothetical protein EYC84_007185 [Monilinia fructicola]|uniref:Uncharacterized protein n=1 Tax=Monilinia fructicola TaxID=38448 RepID=A0A5M9K8K2_MONFR|nr:hypothetical protein EYC84_007185 [Monilinia fructicola]